MHMITREPSCTVILILFTAYVPKFQLIRSIKVTNTPITPTIRSIKEAVRLQWQKRSYLPDPLIKKSVMVLSAATR